MGIVLTCHSSFLKVGQPLKYRIWSLFLLGIIVISRPKLRGRQRWPFGKGMTQDERNFKSEKLKKTNNENVKSINPIIKEKCLLKNPILYYTFVCLNLLFFVNLVLILII